MDGCRGRRGRFGLTIIELLVVMSLIAVLMSLLLPALMSARAASRRTQCANRLRNIGLAMMSDTESKRRFPATGYFDVTTGQPYYNWVVSLLPWLDRRDIADRWDLNSPNSAPANQAVGKINVEVLVCPSDVTTVAGAGNLSYVVNAGFGWTVPVDCPATFHLQSGTADGTQLFDLNGNGIVCPATAKQDGNPTDLDLFFQGSMFFGENRPVGLGTVRFHTPDSVKDGLSNTILLSENIRAGVDPFNPQINWSSPEPRYCAFILSGFVCADNTCSSGNVDYRRGNDRSSRLFMSEAINAGLTLPEGEAPWPSSYHNGGVYVIFGDGHVKFLAESVDGRVYASLLSPQGQRISGPLIQQVLSDNDY